MIVASNCEIKRITPDGKRSSKVFLIGTAVPATLPEDGTDIGGLGPEFIFEPMSILLVPSERKTWIYDGAEWCAQFAE